jgi:hypothetical protein
LEFIPTPQTPSYCVFGGKDHKTLYITAGKSLYRITLNAEDFAVFWPKEKGTADSRSTSSVSLYYKVGPHATPLSNIRRVGGCPTRS